MKATTLSWTSQVLTMKPTLHLMSFYSEMAFRSIGLKKQGVNVETYSIADGKLHLTLRLKLRHHMEAIQKFLEEDRGISSWVNLGISVAIAVLIVFVLLKLERKVSRKWIFKHDDINTRYTEKIIRMVL